MRFALTELKMATVALVQNFKFLKCDETEVCANISLNVFKFFLAGSKTEISVILFAYVVPGFYL